MLAFFRAHVEAGFAPDQFWGLSPRLYLHQMRAAAARARSRAQERAWLAWHSGALAREGVKLPDPRQFIGAADKPRRARQDRATLQAMCDALAIAWGAKKEV